MSADVVIRYWAGARSAAGVESETIHAASVGDALAVALANRPGNTAYARALLMSTVLIDGVAQRRTRLADPIDQAVLAEILPPFAGGSQNMESRLRK